MGKNLTQKIIEKHQVDEEGNQIAIKIDQTLTQDATGTMAYLQFEAMGISKVKTELSVSYVDHNTLQTGFENADDHRFLQTVAAKYGIFFSRPGNGICHQVHRERFAIPGKTLLGSDSHTPTPGGLGMLAIGAGGLDVAAAMGGAPFYVPKPKVVGIKLTGKLKPWVTGKDVILEILRITDVKGMVGKVMEFYGPGLTSLDMGDRFTIANMGTETGATSTIFPTDDITKDFFKAEGREKDFVEAKADDDAAYDETMELNLDEIEPMVAKPSSPGNVVKISELKGMKVDQCMIGTCVNSSYQDLMTVAHVFKHKHVHPDVGCGVAPGSKQVLEMVTKAGGLLPIIKAGARILESACGFCIGMGQAPPTDAISVRTGNRNFPGRSGTKDDKVYLVSPGVAAACAVTGKMTNPNDLGIEPPSLEEPKEYIIDDTDIIPPPKDGTKVEIHRGPNIKPLPLNKPIADSLAGKVLIKLEDNITTDHIMPAGAKILPLRSNLPAISEFVFCYVDDTFVKRAKKEKGGFIVGGENYGQGSSREHAALAPMFLGIKAVFAMSFARIHKANLINFGIMPLEFVDSKDYDAIDKDDELEIPDIKKALEAGKTEITINNKTKNKTFTVKHDLTARLIKMMLAGGKLNYIKQQS